MQVLASSCSQLAGTQLQTRTQIKRANRSASLACRASSDQSTRRQLLSFGALFAAASVVPGAKADLVADLLSKSATNKALHDRQRLATSGANFHNSRTIADGTCAFPKNLFGCGNHVVAGDVKFISDDIKIECEGKEPGKCNSRVEAAAMPKAFALPKRVATDKPGGSKNSL
ncbi:hypothetical protein ABBQ38_005621 [Trebouxia sp. C0009 RCD-2024]